MHSDVFIHAFIVIIIMIYVYIALFYFEISQSA